MHLKLNIMTRLVIILYRDLFERGCTIRGRLRTRVLHPRLLKRLVRFRSAALLDEVLARAEARRRPRTARPRLAVRVAVHHVDALEREVRGLIEEEVDDDRAGEVARGEDEPVPEGDRLDDEGREEREEEVPEPVARRRQRGLPGARAGRERLTDEDPDTSVVEERLLSMMTIAL